MLSTYDQSDFNQAVAELVRGDVTAPGPQVQGDHFWALFDKEYVLKCIWLNFFSLDILLKPNEYIFSVTAWHQNA